MDAVQRANSGHPGMPMGMADIAEVLWNDYLAHNPRNPDWPNRDRFVVSNGHGSMLLYSLLHLSGYDLPMESLKQFRQLHSQTPGHPEIGVTPGVETTTGPLGQGLANAVGMAISEQVLGARFNRDGQQLIDHYTYAFAGDGCLMEGISHEASSLAGQLQLGKLIVFYDDNHISIDGDTAGWFSDDSAQRFAAYGWHVIPQVDGHDAQAIQQAIEQARAEKTQPTLICCKTIIGYGSPNKQERAAAHGAPLGDDEIALVRKNIDWPHPPFEIPDDVRAAWDAVEKGSERQRQWDGLWEEYRAQHPAAAAEFSRYQERRLPDNFAQWQRELVESFEQKADDMATRKASLAALNELSKVLPELIGGSADLAESNCVLRKDMRPLTESCRDADYIYYGVREFAMSAISNGIALHGGLIPYAATFLVFSDYARNAIRMAALMEQRVLFVFTHDSIGLGEDGPTHQPIEHLSSLRLIPNLDVWRPCDTVESLVAWCCAIERNNGPSVLVFSRQTLPHVTRDSSQLDCVKRGGYVVRDGGTSPDAVVIATGSEVSLALAVSEKMAQQNISLRVVSMPCCEAFDRQDASYREAVLPPSTMRISIEAGTTDLWKRYTGMDGLAIGIDHFGMSAPAKEIFAHCGLTVDDICKTLSHKLKSTR